MARRGTSVATRVFVSTEVRSTRERRNLDLGREEHGG